MSLSLENLLADFARLLWDPWLIVLLFGTHLFLTFRLGFIQRYIGRAIRISFSKDTEAKGDVSQFGALMTALAATIGVGNIFGVATAVASGGPGAVFWMWLTGVFGIATKYAEAVLAVKYRVTTSTGQMAGGPMYALEHGLKAKWLGVIFAIFTATAAFGIGNMTQANAIVGFAQTALPTWDPNSLKWALGITMAGLTAVTILGGVQSISKICSALVPFMAIFYILGCAIILVRNYTVLPETFQTIFQSAFTGHAAFGGFLGATMKEAMRYGIARGLFSNESGMGSAPIIAAAAQTRNPVRQALVSATGTFWDTVVVCAMTGLVIVSSGHWKTGLKKAELTHAAFADLHTVGPIILYVGLVTFVFSTILGWSYYGERAAEYLLGSRVIKPYRYLWVAAVLVGSVASLETVWLFADVMNGLMAIPNLIALIALSGVVVAETRAYSHELTGKSQDVPRVSSLVEEKQS